MRFGDQAAKQDDARVPRVATACDPAELTLTPLEGFLLSRIDGHTPWQHLLEMGGMPAHDVDRCLARWLDEGVIEIEGESRASKPAVIHVDAALQIDVELQRRVLSFAENLERPYHEILGVAVDADSRTIKKAYFQLSKLVHPDRYFRRETGPFGPLIEQCFKKLLEAYELLSDPATRKEVQAQAEAQSAAAAEESTEESAEESRRPSRVEASRRLRRRVGAGPHRVVAQRKRKAKSFFESGMAAFGKEHWLEAAGSVRLAIAFDPRNEAYKERFVDVQRKAHEERAKSLVKQAEGALEMRDYEDAFNCLEEACHYRPADAELSWRAGRLAWQSGQDLKRAKDLAAAACELEPDNPIYRRTLGQVYKAAGLTSNARRELEAAIELDPTDKETRAELRTL